MTGKRKPKSDRWKNRIVGHGEKPADQFLANPMNARRHPGAQREMMRSLLSSVGWVTGVIENIRTGFVVDGHERIEEALSKGDMEPVPYIQVDLSEEEERLVLATFDPIGEMAFYDAQAEQALLDEIETENETIDAFLAGRRAGIELQQAAAGKDGAKDGRDALKKSGIVTVRAVIACKNVALVERALRETGLMNRGEALAEISREYLHAKGQFDLPAEDELAEELA